MTKPEQTDSANPANLVEHFREVNRRFDDTPEASAYRLEACFTEQLKELGLFHHFHHFGEGSDVDIAFDFIDPTAVRVIIDAFISGKLPQPEGPGSILFSDRTAIGRQAALDTTLERVRSQTPYDITTDPDFYQQ